MPRFILPCIEGIEPEVAQDALDLGGRGAVAARGRVHVEADEDFLYRANLAHPTASRVLLVVAQGKVASVKEIEALVEDVAWEDLFGLDRTFAGDAVRVGQHAFTSLEVAKAVGDGVCARFRRLTHGAARPPVDLDAPDVRIVVHVRDAMAYVCVDTTGAPLQQRPWRVFKPKAPLPAMLASALVARAGWKGGLLLDPVCGSATIPIEADFRARRRAVNLPRSEWAFLRLRAHDTARYEEVRDEMACRALDEAPGGMRVLGNEQWARNVEGARQNVAAAGAHVDLREADFNDLARPEGLTTLVANPPWGLRIASRRLSDRVGAQLRAKMLEWAATGPYSGVVIVGNRRFEKEPPHPVDARDCEVGGTYCRILGYRFP